MTETKLSLGDIIKSAAEVKGKLEEVQQKLARSTTTADSGGGMVTVKVNGVGEVLQVSLDPAIVDPGDIEMLQDLITAAVNAAMRKSRAMSKEMMQEKMLGFPGMPDMSGFFGS